MKTIFISVITALLALAAEPTIKPLTDQQKAEYLRLRVETETAKARLNATLAEVHQIIPALTKTAQTAADAEAAVLGNLRKQNNVPPDCYPDAKQDWVMSVGGKVVPCKAPEKPETKK